jgi:hypothetical protein
MKVLRAVPVVLLAVSGLVLSAMASPVSQAAVTVDPPAPPGTIVGPLATGPASMIRSDFVGNGHRNFEAVVLQGTKLVQYWKDNSDPGLAWHRGQVITANASGPGAIVQSDFLSGGHGNLEVVVPEGGQLVHYWHDSGNPNARWQRATTFGSGVTGAPSFITSDFTSAGHRNFEVVVQEGANLVHYFHPHDAGNDRWQRGQVIATGVSSGGSLIQTDFTGGGHGNLEVIVRQGSQLAHYWHDNGQPSAPWQRAASFGTGVTGAPSFIQSSIGAASGHGNFEVVVPEGSTLGHYWLDNSHAGTTWARGAAPSITGVSSSATLVQSDYGNPGNLELLVLGGRAPVPAGSQVEGNVTDYRLLHYWHDSSNASAAWGLAGDVAYRGRSEKICQLTSTWDTERLAPTTNGTGGLAYSHWGTDLGAPIDDGTTLSLMFGDTHLNHTPIATDELVRDDDVVLQTTDTAAPTDTRCLQLKPVPNATTFTPADVTVGGATDPNFLQGFFNVPTSGFVANGVVYAGFWTNHCMAPDHCAYGSNPVGDGYLTKRLADPRKYDKLFKLPPQFVYNTAVNAAVATGVPADQRLGVFLWGIPKYRESYPYLAYAPAGSLENQSTWRYLTGVDASGGPVWSADPTQSKTVFTTGDPAPCIGEFSVSYVQPLGKWVMVYGCGSSGGVAARTANAPWGPWSAPSTIFDPGSDNGLCHFIHHGSGTCDRAQDAPWTASGGGPYAPYILDRYTTGTAGRATLYYLLSTWNPYQVVVMRTTITS